MNEKHKPQFLLHSKNNILFLIINQFLTCKDVLVLQKTCIFFHNLLRPNPSNMVCFCNYADSKHMTETTIIWDHLKLQNCRIQMFNTHNQLQLQNVKIFSTSTNEMTFSESAFAVLLNDGRIVAWGNENLGGKIPADIQPQLQNENVKMIVSTYEAFAALLNDGRVVAWGNKKFGGKIPDNIKPQLRNVKMICSTFNAFAALLNDGRVVAWGHQLYGGKIPDDIQPQLENVKMICSTSNAFAALLNDGSVVAWGNEKFGGKIPDDIQPQLHSVMIVNSDEWQFTAVCINGDTFTWGFR